MAPAGDYWAELSRQTDAVYAAHPDLRDHRRAHSWLTGALGDPASRIWFVGENPSLGMVERARDPDGGPPSHEAQWWASRGDRLFRDMLVKHGFKDAPAEAPGGWHCYITNVIKETDYAGNWRGSPAQRHARAAEVWAPVLAWELAQSRPILVVALGQTVRRILSVMEARGLPLPRIETIQHYAYVGHRPQGTLGPMHPDRVRAYDEEFAHVAALLALGEEGIAALPEPGRRGATAGSPGGPRKPRHTWREGDDLVAFYLQRHGTDRLPHTLSDIAHRLGIEDGTLRMRIANFKGLDGPGGLRNWAQQSERVYRRNRDLDEAELRERMLAYLASLPDRGTSPPTVSVET